MPGKQFADSVFSIVADAALSKEEKAAALKSLVQPDATMTMKSATQARNAEMLRAIAGANASAGRIQGTHVMPPLGGVSDSHLRPDIAPKVPEGAARPYAPGEFTRNPDDSWSSERSMTVQNPDGSWAVIPSLWLKDGRPYEAAGEDEAMRLATASKLPFKKFKSLDEAEKFSIDREAEWQPIENPEDADKIAPLWDAAPAAAKPAPALTAPRSAIGAPAITQDPIALADEIEKRKNLTLAAFGTPTTYPSLGGP